MEEAYSLSPVLAMQRKKNPMALFYLGHNLGLSFPPKQVVSEISKKAKTWIEKVNNLMRSRIFTMQHLSHVSSWSSISTPRSASVCCMCQNTYYSTSSTFQKYITQD